MEYNFKKEITTSESIHIATCRCGKEPKINNYISGSDGCASHGGTTISCKCGATINKHSYKIGYGDTKTSLMHSCINAWNKIME